MSPAHYMQSHITVALNCFDLILHLHWHDTNPVFDKVIGIYDYYMSIYEHSQIWA